MDVVGCCSDWITMIMEDALLGARPVNVIMSVGRAYGIVLPEVL